MNPFIEQVKDVLSVDDLSDDERAKMLERVLITAANKAFDAIHLPAIALEKRVGAIFDDMVCDDTRFWNGDHLEGVIHVMRRLEEMRKGNEAQE
jgi:hypothetical protein